MCIVYVYVCKVKMFYLGKRVSERSKYLPKYRSLPFPFLTSKIGITALKIVYIYQEQRKRPDHLP